MNAEMDGLRHCIAAYLFKMPEHVWKLPISFGYALGED